MTEIQTPEWVKHAIFYQIFPDRFARSSRLDKHQRLEPWDSPPTIHGYKGGDLFGVLEKLDYLQDLGVTALYFNPVFQSASNHRYHTHDYYQVDPMLGGNAALRELLDAAHARGMKVVLDGVFNHASRGFFQFSDIMENGAASAYLDWFHVEGFPLNAYGGGKLGYIAWWDLPALPKFNTDNQAVREFLWDVACYWLEFGIDGWRLDVPNEIDDDAFWQEFRQRCRRINPECYIVGEIWEDASRWLQGDQFDAVMNYPLTKAIFGFAAQKLNAEEIAKCGYKTIGPLDAPGFARALEQVYSYPKAINEAQLNLLGSHDTPRALTVLQEDETALRLALFLLFTLPGAPCIYYGDELGLSANNDPDCRQAMPWHDEPSWNHDLKTYIKQLIATRKAHPALALGEWIVLHASDGLLVFERIYDGEILIAVVNVNPHPIKIDVKLRHRATAGEYDALERDLHLRIMSRRLLFGQRLVADDLPARSAVLFGSH